MLTVKFGVANPNRSDSSKNVFQGRNGIAMRNHDTGETLWFYNNDDSGI